MQEVQVEKEEAVFFFPSHKNCAVLNCQVVSTTKRPVVCTATLNSILKDVEKKNVSIVTSCIWWQVFFLQL